jgi:hypothetical protein
VTIINNGLGSWFVVFAQVDDEKGHVILLETGVFLRDVVEEVLGDVFHAALA